MNVSILTPSSSPIGSIGTDTLGITRALRSQGHTVQVYAGDWNLATAGDGLSLKDYSGKSKFDGDEVLIFQHAIGWPSGERLLRRSGQFTVIRDHNITPASFYVGVSKLMESACKISTAATRRFARIPNQWFWPASGFNRDQLVGLGVPPSRCLVLPPFHTIERMTSSPPDTSVSGQFGGAGTKLLFVSALWPHKGHARALGVLAEYRRLYDPNARLIMAGTSSGHLPEFERELEQTVENRGLAGAAFFAKNITSGQMRALYANADVLLSVSAHEGFGIPMVEAMHFGLPVVAWGQAAVPETLGEAGILLTEFHETAFATAIHALIQDPGKRQAIGDAGRDRYRRLFETQVLERQVISVLEQTLEGMRRSHTESCGERLV